jgi:hypothetical protein
MSPYGVQRAATRCVMVWAFCNGVGDLCRYYCGSECKYCVTAPPKNRTAYYITHPGGYGCNGTTGFNINTSDCNWLYPGAFGPCMCFCNCCASGGGLFYAQSVGAWVPIDSPHCCEYPIKYVSFDPSVCRTYMMIRSSDDTPWKTGIYHFCATRFNSTRCTNCTFCQIYADSLPYICEYSGICSLDFQKCFWGSIEGRSGCRLFCRVADFPEIMLCQQYINPFMCVSCIFKTKSDTWTLGVYNHCTSKWDPFITNDLINWRNPGNEGIFDFNVNENSRYLVNNSCLELRTNVFDTNIPQCSIIDYDVNANNLERTGLVISNGDRIVVNNKGSVSASVQVWGYEG